MPPFFSENDNEMFMLIMKYNFEFPKEVQVSDALENLVRGLLIKNPDSR